MNLYAKQLLTTGHTETFEHVFNSGMLQVNLYAKKKPTGKTETLTCWKIWLLMTGFPEANGNGLRETEHEMKLYMFYTSTGNAERFTCWKSGF